MAVKKSTRKAVKKTATKTATKKRVSASGVPLTKAGKPDKRYVRSISAPSRATKKAPTKRLKTRRAKPKIAGYSANPAPKKPAYVVSVTAQGRTVYLSKVRRVSGGHALPLVFDDELSKAMPFSPRSTAESIRALVSQMTGFSARVATVASKKK